jgi:hypothetical protein
MTKKCLFPWMSNAKSEVMMDDFWRHGNEKEERRGVGEKRSSGE